MSKAIVFGVGLALGAVGGVVVTLALMPTSGGAPLPAKLERPGPPTDSQDQTDPARLPSLPSTALPAPAPSPGVTAPDTATRAALAQATKDAEARAGGQPRRKADVWRSRAHAMSDWKPESAQHQAWFAEALIDLAGDDRPTAEAAGYALAWAGTQGRLSDAQLNELEGVLPQLLTRYRSDTPKFRLHFYRSIELDPPVEATDPAAWTAWILAQGRHLDPAKLDALIRRVPATQYPSVHLAFLLAIKGRADALHRDYITRLTRESPHGEVLIQAWSLERVGRLGNKVWSTQQLAAFDERLFRMDLAAYTRARGWQAVTDLAVPNSERGLPLLERAAAGGELNTGNRTFCFEAAKLVRGGLIDGAAVQALAAKHPPSE